MPNSGSVWLQQYLDFLQIPPASPSLALLRRLTHQQLLTVTFENVTTLLRYRDAAGEPLPPPNPVELLDHWRSGSGGGLCYEISATFGRLLSEMGFVVWPVMGTITWPDSHQALIVECEGQRFLVDVGNGAPFFDPIRLGDPVQIDHAGLQYRFGPGARADTYLQERRIHGAWEVFCTFRLEPRPAVDLYQAFCRHHQPKEGKFMGELSLVRCTPDTVYFLRNHELTIFTNVGKEEHRLSSSRDFTLAAAEYFRLPGAPVLEALDVLDQLGVEI